MGHTPGPFKVADSTEIIARVPSPSGNYDVLTIARCSDVEIYNDDRAGKTADNVALFAAAPDMLEALKALTTRFESRVSEDMSRYPELAAARAALAKAEGK